MKLKLLKIERFFHLINKKKYNEERQIEVIKKSPLFDAKWYLSQYPDVKNKKMGAVKHYVKYGWKEGRNPSSKFDNDGYLVEFPELKAKGWCPLFHYMLKHKELMPKVSVKESFVEVVEKMERRLAESVEKMEKKLADKCAKKGIKLKFLNKYEGKSKDYILIAKSKYFNKRWYLKKYPDVKKAKVDPVEHYMKYGWKEGRNPSDKFDTEAYLRMYRTVAQANMNPLLHYEKYGFRSNLYIKKPETQEIFDKFPYGTENAIINNLSKRKDKIQKIAVFASYSGNGKVEDYVFYYLRGLRKICDIIIFVSDNPLFPSEVNKLSSFVDYAAITRHSEYDFGSYKRGYSIAKENGLLDKASELILCNDSCYGPVYPFKRMFKTMEKKPFDFWGICANDEFNYHLQSYFLVFKKKVFSSSVFTDFLNSIKQEKNVSDIIFNYEVKFTQVLQSAGFSCGSFVQLSTNDNEYPFMYTHNLTLFPFTLMKLGCPLLKVKAFNKPASNYEGNLLQTYEYVAKNNPELAKYLPKPKHFKQNISFSIIMPTFNRKKFIGQAVDSVLQQTYQNFELIIVDDGSTDNTKKFIEKQYAKEIKTGKIKYIYKENSGVCKTRNVGLKNAKNEWIAYLDSDNLLFPCFLEIFASNIQNHKNKTFYAKCISMQKRNIIGREFDYAKLIKANYIDLGIFVHHRSVYENLGGFDENMTRLVDWDLIACYTKKYTPYFIPVKVMLYNDIDDHVRITNSASYYDNLRYFKKKHTHLDLCTVTAMITSYNHERYISDAIESAVKQRGDFVLEILISDDGSTDRTPQIIEEYAKKYPHIIRNISRKENVGISENMKRCFMEAKGKYIAVLEGDDYWTDGFKLEKQMKFLEKNKDCSMVFSKLKVLNENTQKYSFLERQQSLPKKLDGKNCINEPTLNLMGNFSCCMFVSKHMKNLPDILYKTRLNEIALSFYLEQKGKIGFISTPLSVYRQHVNGVWTGADKINRLKSGLQCRQTAYEVCRNKYKKQLKKIIDEQYIKPLNELENRVA